MGDPNLGHLVDKISSKLYDVPFQNLLFYIKNIQKIILIYY